MKKKIVLVGGGHANSLALIKLSKVKNAEILLVNDGEYAYYSGMVPGYIAGQYDLEQIRINLRRLCMKHGCAFISMKVVYVSAHHNKIILENNDEVFFDLLSINIGSKNKEIALNGASEFGIFTRPLKSLLENIENARNKNKIAIVGAGLAGIELAFAFKSKYKASEIFLVQKKEIAEDLPNKPKQKIVNSLIGQGINLIYNKVSELRQGFVILENSETIKTDLVVLATGASALNLANDLEKCENGFLLVNKHLECIGQSNVFAAGDCITFKKSPNFPPKAGVYAVKESKILASNIKKSLKTMISGKKYCPKTFNPQKDFLKIINKCDGTAIAVKWGTAFEGALAWRLKNKIDTKFMKKFNY